MQGGMELRALIAGMVPVLDEVEQGYGLVPARADLPAGLDWFALIVEAEGVTVIAPVAELAEAGIAHRSGWARISLTVHSDLEAVGLTAAFAAALAAEGISANVVAGLYHDHLFVGWGRRHDAMTALRRLAEGA